MQGHFMSCVSAPQFDANKDFRPKGLFYEGNNGFLRCGRKGKHRNGQADPALLMTWLTTPFENGIEAVEKLVAENVCYNDLGSLTKEDLELIGFKDEREKQELLDYFSQLPNQDPTYDDICRLEEAQTYNRKIIMNASGHLETMRAGLASANYKLQILPPDDVILGEKSFASRFVLQALSELYSLTNGVNGELEELKKIISSKFEQRSQNSSSIRKLRNGIQKTIWLLLGSLSSIGAFLALYYWKLN
uniref:SAM domain-containing protein n=1 Tax=Glossina pallidipes TaxID=7398 RepID=A0A1A9ZEX9_GLOPL